MRLDPVLTQIETTIEAQLRLADPGVAEEAAAFMEAFWPAVRSALLEVAQQAATEIEAQLGDRRVEVRLSNGDPEMVVSPLATGDRPLDEDPQARITLRLPPSLKGAIEDAASSAGDSINTWVVDALRSRARRSNVGTRVEETFEL
ncbi:MAG: toxin-antitoxin system HicB family antitoxin [Actinomycetota bacterium]